MNTSNLPRIGAHLPIGKGLRVTAEQARELGLEALQVFLRNPRGMKARQLQDEETSFFSQQLQEAAISPLVVHIPYVSNPAAVKEDIYQLALRIINEDLARGERVGADYLVLHPGAYTTSSADAAIDRLVALLNRVLDNYSGAMIILIETMAGQGTEIGRNFEEMVRILDGVTESSRVGCCLDTCHLTGAGYDLTSEEGVNRLDQDIEASIGRERVRLVHANDSSHPPGSRRDRHAPIGSGYIGEDGFRIMLQHPYFKQLPFILETPFETIAADVNTLKRLRGTERS